MRPKRRILHRALALCLLIGLLASACAADTTISAEAQRAPIAEPDPAPTAVDPAVDPTAVVPTVVEATEPDPAPASEPPVATPPATEDPEATPTPVPTPQPPGPCGVGPLALPNPDRPVYEVELDVNPEAGTVTGTMQVDFTPDLAVDELVLRLWPNGPRLASGGVELSIDNVTVERDGQRTVPEIARDPATIVRVPLDEPLAANSTIRLAADFDLVIPGEFRSRVSSGGDFMRLGTVLPLLPWEPGVGWAVDPATTLFAEAVLSPVADYSVKVNVPDGFDVLASGVVDELGVWRVEAARDFALSIGRFRLVSGTAMAPEPVNVIVGVHETLGDDESAYLAKVIDSLEQFSDRWGQYPWPSLTFALTPDLRGGIEFPTHIMQGQDTLGRTTSHEVGHMWFYSLVGNNQGAEPWLDEGITSYAEFTYEGVAPGAYAIPEGGVGNATQPMPFWEGRSDIYYRSVYGQTGFALQRLGSQEDVDCALARYVAANAHGIARAADFVAAFEPTFPNVIEQLADLGVALE